MTDNTPRGVRGNNPGNIRWGQPWQGLVPEAQRTDKDFCQFIAPAWGIRALCRTLITYQDNYGLNTVQGIIERWAPPGDNNNTPAYIEAVASDMGIGSQVQLNTHSYADLLPLAKGIIHHENGEQPYDAITLDKGLQLAGVVQVISTPLKTRVGKAIAATVSSGGIAAAISAKDQIDPLLHTLNDAADGNAHFGDWIKLLAVVLALVSVACGIYAYLCRSQDNKAVTG